MEVLELLTEVVLERGTDVSWEVGMEDAAKEVCEEALERAGVAVGSLDVEAAGMMETFAGSSVKARVFFTLLRVSLVTEKASTKHTIAAAKDRTCGTQDPRWAEQDQGVVQQRGSLWPASPGCRDHWGLLAPPT